MDTELNDIVSNLEACFGLNQKINGLPLAAEEFSSIRGKKLQEFKEMSKEELQALHISFEPSLERLSHLSFRVGYQTIRLIDLDALDPVDKSMRLMSIYTTQNSLRTNVKKINDVINYFSNLLGALDKETLQNKNGLCYRLIRLFMLMTMARYPMGSSIIAVFLLANIKGGN